MLIPYQGYLETAGGNPLNGDYQITFSLTREGATSPEWTEIQTVKVEDGIFNAMLGSIEPLSSLNFARQYLIRTYVEDDPPPVAGAKLGSVPYALGILHALRVEPVDIDISSANLIGGHPKNSVATGVVGAAIGGGGHSDATPFSLNRVLGDFGVIGGGAGNRAGGTLFSSITGRRYATTGGGWGNEAAEEYATVGGGRYNSSFDHASTVCGGAYNKAGMDDGMAAAQEYATIGGGHGNSAMGAFSTIPGGERNSTLGMYSAAMGYMATALHTGTFVWNDRSQTTGTETDAFTSTGDNQFLIRAVGGVGIGTDAPEASLDVLGGNWDVANGEGDFRIGDASYRLKMGVATDGGGAGDARIFVAGGTERLLFGAADDIIAGIDAGGIRPYGTHDLGTNESPWEAVFYRHLREVSDERLKHDIEDLPYGLNEILGLSPVAFRWRDGDSSRQLGFVAQEVESILPEAVSGGSATNGVLTLEYSAIVAALVRAVQEQQQQIENQDRLIRELRTTITK
jgi:hypothetical protein